MAIFIYSDESGVFDQVHNDIFVFGGLIFLSKDEKDKASRKFAKVEATLRKTGGYGDGELKACKISAKDKNKVFRSMNDCIKFGVVIRQKRILREIFNDKKSKQRYLDFAYKMALKKALEKLLSENRIDKEHVDDIHIFVDEHTTATNGRYELEEALYQEFKIGTFNWKYSIFFEPIFKSMKSLNVKFCNSSTTRLVRAADIVANQIFYNAINNLDSLYLKDNMYLIDLP